MKYKITIEADTETGDYEVGFNNLTDREAGVDYHLAMEIVRRVIGDFQRQTGGQADVDALFAFKKAIAFSINYRP